MDYHSANQSPKTPVEITRTCSFGSTKLAAVMSHVRVPEPATMKGCPFGAIKTLRRSSIDSPKVLINPGSTWDVAGVDIVPRTVPSNSTGPGIIQSLCGGPAGLGFVMGGTGPGAEGVTGVTDPTGDRFETDDSDPDRARPVESLANIFNVASRKDQMNSFSTS